MARTQIIDRDRGWRDLKNRMQQTGAVAVKVGILEGAGTHNRETEGAPLTVAQVAAINEYGSSDGVVPERPAWRNALDNGKDKIVKALRRAAEEITDGDTADTALGRVGLMGQALIRRGIDQLTTPPNAPRTIAEKGSSKPLIDTAQTRNSVTYGLIHGAEVDAARKGAI
jgi:hypothetical protein